LHFLIPHKQDRSSSDEIIGETSDIISAISNEECSVASEILDQRASSEVITIGEMIQDLNDDRISHIDSPETSETTTDALHGESLFDDISSVLGHDFFGALGDSTFTDDTTLCKEEGSNLQRSRNKSLKNKKSVDSCATQYGFENRIFDIPDMEKEKQQQQQPIRYCSLARFEEGSDISRKSFRHSQRSASAMTKSASIMKQLSNSTQNYTTCSNNTSEDQETNNPNSSDTTTTTTTTTIAEKPMELNTIKIQIQGSISDCKCNLIKYFESTHLISLSH
jgi:diacylglycerol kinase (ATP)